MTARASRRVAGGRSVTDPATPAGTSSGSARSGTGTSTGSSSGGTSAADLPGESPCEGLGAEPVPAECEDWLEEECGGNDRQACADQPVITSGGGSLGCAWAVELEGETTCVEGAGACIPVLATGEGGPGPRYFDDQQMVVEIQCEASAIGCELNLQALGLTSCLAQDAPAACGCMQ